MAAARQIEDLIVWQMAVKLRDEILGLTESGRIAKDWSLCDQIRDSARSAPRNLAEGFDRFQPREFAHFARIARGSLGETKNHLLDGATRGYLSKPDADRLIALATRCRKSTTRLMRYLCSCKGKAPTGWDFDDKKR